MDNYTPPTPAQVREFLRTHNLTGSQAAELAGLNDSSAIRKYTGGKTPTRMSYAVWFTLHAKTSLSEADIDRIDGMIKIPPP